MKLKNRKRTKKEVKEAMQFFLDGGKMTTDQAIEHFYNSNTPLQYMLSKDKARGFLSTTLKKAFAKKGLSFGCINDKGEYGIASSEAEARYQIMFLYRFTKGINVNAKKLVAYAQMNNLLPAGIENERIALPKVK